MTCPQGRHVQEESGDQNQEVGFENSCTASKQGATGAGATLLGAKMCSDSGRGGGGRLSGQNPKGQLTKKN